MFYDSREICGTCIYHQYDKQDDEWCCDNENSNRYTDWTEYTDTCGEWDWQKEQEGENEQEIHRTQ